MVRVRVERYRFVCEFKTKRLKRELGDYEDLIVLTVKVPVWMKEYLMRVARERRETMSDVIRRAIVYYLESIKVGGGGQEEE